MKLHLGRPDSLDFETLICEMPDHEFQNLTRSTIPLLSYWASPAERLTAICCQLGISVPDDVQLYFEYPVPSVGRAKASFTDIMGISDSLCVAIEGKSTESDYDTVAAWLAKGGVSRPPVLTRWLELIASKTGVQVSPNEFSNFNNVTYQMIHRTASACSLKRPRTVVVYQVFDVNGKLPEYKAKLEGLAAAIGAEGKIDILLNIIKVRHTNTYETTETEIKEMKDKSVDEKEIAQSIRSAILDGKLFEFEVRSWDIISTSGASAMPGN